MLTRYWRQATGKECFKSNQTDGPGLDHANSLSLPLCWRLVRYPSARWNELHPRRGIAMFGGSNREPCRTVLLHDALERWLARQSQDWARCLGCQVTVNLWTSILRPQSPCLFDRIAGLLNRAHLHVPSISFYRNAPCCDSFKNWKGQECRLATSLRRAQQTCHGVCQV